jgi:uncharacterized SAM-binding protein YcdF (DUF218 family)
LNRIADVLLEPLWLALALIALGYVLAFLRRAPRVAVALPALAALVLLVFSNPQVSNDLLHGLEVPPLDTMDPAATYDAVIVLGGAMNPAITRATGRPAFNESAERVLTAFDLLRANRAKNAILTGGLGPDAPPDLRSEARLMADQLEAWGIEPSRLALDEHSTNTHENAVASTKIARERGWSHDLLLTSAAHMARARGCFRREGLSPDVLQVDFNAYDPKLTRAGWLPRASALSMSTGAIREWVGRVVYRLRGWSE